MKAHKTKWLPAISVPLPMGANGMPVGVRVIGRPGHDGDGAGARAENFASMVIACGKT